MRRWLLPIAVAVLALVAVALFLVWRAGPGGLAGASPTPTPSPTPIPIDEQMLGSRFTVLLVGTDQNATRRASGEPPLTDSMIVLSVDASHRHLVMVSVPRDTVDVPLPDGSIWHEKLNALFAKDGIDTLRQALGGLLGTTIDHAIVVDMDDFAAIVDAFGGVDVKVTEAIRDPSVGLNVAPGTRHLDGRTALAYSRSRHTTNDFSRAARQQQVLLALLHRFTDPSVKVDIAGLLPSLAHLQTDLDGKIATLAEIARRSRGAAVTTEVLQPPRFYAVRSDPVRGYILLPDLEAIRAFARPLFADAATATPAG